MKKTISLLRIFIIILPFFLLISITGKAQNIDAAIEKYAGIYSPERAYFHLDKSGYAAGETVWFKAYLMNEIIAATESKTLYVDWIDDKGKLLQHIISPIIDGITTGQFDIPADYKGKFLHLKAYTKWMLNFDSAFLYNRDVRVFTKEISAASETKNNPSVINFFPEGGDIVAGIKSKIAFKANDQWGRPIKVKGIIINSQGKTEDSLHTMHDGMGYFFLIPGAGTNYNAKWKDEKGIEYNTALPNVKSSGVVMSIALSGSNRVFNINYTADLAAASDSLYIIGTMYQHEVFKVIKSTASEIKGTIPGKNLPSGILTITVFDKNWLPLAERITYIDNQEYFFNSAMEVEHWGLNKRAKNTIKIKVPDTIAANLSVSITDAGIGADSSNNIISHLMLSSELKGQVYNPSYYFSNPDEMVMQHLDLVMLTHGWRRFKWADIVKGNVPAPVYKKDTTYISLSGKVMGLVPGEIGNDASIILILRKKEKNGDMLILPVEKNGTFNNSNSIFFDTAQVYYQFQKSMKSKRTKDASVQFMIDKIMPPSLKGGSGNRSYNFWTDTTGSSRQYSFANEANILAEKSRSKILENVTVQSKAKPAKQVLEEKYTSGLFSGGDAIDFDLVNDPIAGSAIDIFSYLQGKVAGLQITMNNGEPSMQWRGGTPALYLDEVATDADMVSGINVNDIAYVKVFRPPFMGGSGNGSGGAISIYTRRGNDVKPTAGKGLNNNLVTGYTLIKEFYSPNYAAFNEKDIQKDIRTTLYWNPLISTSPKNHEISISFYNNDVSNSFRVIIEGMTADGRLTHLEQVME
ncbi:MAG: hypothetical protein ABJA78_05015 [Ferruginibacter sp.]